MRGSTSPPRIAAFLVALAGLAGAASHAKAEVASESASFAGPIVPRHSSKPQGHAWLGRPSHSRRVKLKRRRQHMERQARR
jgi:nicotinamide mononucleotide (NMN) deamidase PncC